MQGRRFLAWYAAAPHAGKKFPDLETFMFGKSAAADGRDVSVDDSMMLWCAAMAAADG